MKRVNGPVRFKFSGDRKIAGGYIKLARKYLGGLETKAGKELGRKQFNRRHILPGGVGIYVENRFGQMYSHIYVPVQVGEEELDLEHVLIWIPINFGDGMHPNLVYRQYEPDGTEIDTSEDPLAYSLCGAITGGAGNSTSESWLYHESDNTIVLYELGVCNNTAGLWKDGLLIKTLGDKTWPGEAWTMDKDLIIYYTTGTGNYIFRLNVTTGVTSNYIFFNFGGTIPDQVRGMNIDSRTGCGGIAVQFGDDLSMRTLDGETHTNLLVRDSYDGSFSVVETLDYGCDDHSTNCPGTTTPKVNYELVSHGTIDANNFSVCFLTRYQDVSSNWYYPALFYKADGTLDLTYDLYDDTGIHMNSRHSVVMTNEYLFAGDSTSGKLWRWTLDYETDLDTGIVTLTGLSDYRIVDTMLAGEGVDYYGTEYFFGHGSKAVLSEEIITKYRAKEI